jgi:hypothetical protein
VAGDVGDKKLPVRIAERLPPALRCFVAENSAHLDATMLRLPAGQAACHSAHDGAAAYAPSGVSATVSAVVSGKIVTQTIAVKIF